MNAVKIAISALHAVPAEILLEAMTACVIPDLQDMDQLVLVCTALWRSKPLHCLHTYSAAYNQILMNVYKAMCVQLILNVTTQLVLISAFAWTAIENIRERETPQCAQVWNNVNQTSAKLASFWADIDECSEESYHCSPHSTCRNTPGSYECLCSAGFRRNGSACVGRGWVCV